MALKARTFEVSLDSEASMIVLGCRFAMANYLRGYFRKKIEGAEDAGVDRMTAVQRAALDWGKATRGSRMLRSIPASLVSWTSYAEFNGRLDWFIPVYGDTFGTFDRTCIQSLAGGVKMVKLGGLNFVGIDNEPLPGDLFEVRIWKSTTGNLHCTYIVGRPDDDSGEHAPQPVEPEMEDA